jgi:hypothetical protein
MKRAAGLALASVILALLASCVSPPAPTPPETPVVEIAPAPQEEVPVSPQPEEPAPIQVQEPQEPKPEPVPEVVPEPEQVSPVEEIVEPEVLAELPPSELAIPETPVPQPKPFDPAKITPQVYDSTKTDVQAVIDHLNKLIQNKDYDTWLYNLTPEYIKAMSDPDFLALQSESKVLQKFNIRLRSLRDYFFYVVVPSRKVDRVDEIVFISETQVRAYMYDEKGEKLLLYELEKKDNMWKIGPGR